MLAVFGLMYFSIEASCEPAAVEFRTPNITEKRLRQGGSNNSTTVVKGVDAFRQIAYAKFGAQIRRQG
jgi:hypothetical protein